VFQRFNGVSASLYLYSVSLYRNSPFFLLASKILYISKRLPAREIFEIFIKKITIDRGGAANDCILIDTLAVLSGL
jgi:hypothetical protein